jgi:hypothetical protein
MTCDEYFDYLTSAPPSTAVSGSPDDASPGEGPPTADQAAAHLAGCPRCRSLAEALEPAINLFRGAAAEPRADQAARGQPDDDVPSWLLAAMDEADREASVQAPPHSSPGTALHGRPSHELPRGRTETSRRGVAWPALAAMLIGLLVGGAVWGVGAVGQRDESIHGAYAWPALSAIQLSPACMAPRGSAEDSSPGDNTASPPPGIAASPPGDRVLLATLAQSERDHLNCCTSCHALGRVAAAACDARLLAVSCQACHAR